MNFDELNEIIPYTAGGKQKILSMKPYYGITLMMPGRHQKDTDPVGGDFVVAVNTFKKSSGQFTHIDIFQDIELKSTHSMPHGWNAGTQFMGAYLEVINGADPLSMSLEQSAKGIEPTVLLCAVQCLAVAEHRRYAKHEAKFGGRFLPFRFSAGISEGLWTAADAAEKQKRGRPGVEWLERDHGVPALTTRLMSV